MTYGPSEMRSVEKLKSEYFPYGTNSWLIIALLYSDHEVVGKLMKYYLRCKLVRIKQKTLGLEFEKFLENLRRVIGKLFAD